MTLRPTSLSALCAIALGLLPIGIYASDGTLDATFTPPALSTGVYDLVTEDDGSCVVVGHFAASATVPHAGIVKLTSAGAVDTTFATGLAGANVLPITSIVRQNDGKYVVCGAFSQMHGVARNSVARLNADGTLDFTFNPGVGPNRIAGSRIGYSLVIQPDGKILLGGQFTTWNGISRAGLVRLHSDGSLDTSFANLDDTVNFFAGAEMVKSVALQSTTSAPYFNVLVGGVFYGTWSGTNHGGVVRLTSIGVRDTTFAIGSGSLAGTSVSPVSAVAVQADGKIIVGGVFGSFNGTANRSFVRLNSDGSNDTIFNSSVGAGVTGSSAEVFKCLIQPDGKILAGGFFTSASGSAAPGLVRYNATGTRDTSFVAETSSAIGLAGLRLQNDGLVLAGLYGSTDTSKMLRRLSNAVPDPGVIQFASPTAMGTEGTSVALTLERVGGSTGSLSIIYGAIEGTATQPFDFSGVSGTVTWADGETSTKTISVPLPVDGTLETDETFGIHIVGVGPARLGSNRLSTVTIQDADVAGGQPVVIFRSASQTVSEDTLTVTVPVDLSAPATSAVTVPFTISGTAFGPAKTPKDYSTLPASPLVFAIGEQSKDITVTLVNDTTPEPDETIIFRIPNTIGAVLDGTRNLHTLTIADNEVKPVIAVHPQHVLAFVGQPQATFTGGATGLPAPTLQWLRNGAAMTGLTSNGISISKVSLAAAATFSLRASNKMGAIIYSATSTTAELGVVDKTERTVVLPAGTLSNAVLTVPTAGKLLTYEWRNANGDPLPASSRILNVTTKTLTIKGLTTSDTGAYICRVKGPDPAQFIDVRHNLKVVTEKPVITDALIDLGTVVVSEPIISFQIHTLPTNTATDDRAAATFRADVLPAGIKLDAVTGIISGRPTIAKPTGYAFKVFAKNPKGETLGVPVKLVVNAIPDKIVGSYIGHVAQESTINPRGGRVDFSIATTGVVTGKFILGAAIYSFTGALNTSIATPDVSTAAIPVTGTSLVFAFTYTASTGKLSLATLSDGSHSSTITGWRNVWNPAPLIKPYAGYYTMALNAPSPQTKPVPQGNGYASFTIAATGTLTVSGKLAEGTAFTTSGFVGPDGNVLVYQMLYANKGSIIGLLDIAEGSLADYSDNSLTGDAVWTRDETTPSSLNRTYAAGFTNAPMTAIGGRYKPITTAEIVMYLNDEADNAVLNFNDGGLGSNANDPNPDCTLRLKKGGLVVYPLPNTNLITLVLYPTTGLFSGTFTITQKNNSFTLPKDEKRVGSFIGMFVKDASGQSGYGHFLLPELSTPTVGITLTKRLSGQVVLDARPPPSS